MGCRVYLDFSFLSRFQPISPSESEEKQEKIGKRNPSLKLVEDNRRNLKIQLIKKQKKLVKKIGNGIKLTNVSIENNTRVLSLLVNFIFGK